MSEEAEQVFSGPCHTFVFDPHNFGPTLSRFNIAMPGGKFPGFTEYSKQVEERTEKYTVYRCDEMQRPLLLVYKLDKYTFFFYIETEEYLAAWKQKYSFSGPKALLKDWLPEPPAEIKYIEIPMNTSVLGPR